MDQLEFVKWINASLGGASIEDVTDEQVLRHMDRVVIEAIGRIKIAHAMGMEEDAKLHLLACMQTVFRVGFQTGREQGEVDNLFNRSSGDDNDLTPV